MDPQRLMAALDATWPAAEVIDSVPGWRIRRGEGGGRRVSAATGAGDIAAAEAAMRGLGQTPIFRLGPGEDDLDRALAARGYLAEAPTVLYAAPAAALAAAPPRKGVRVVRVRARLALLDEIWEAGGIGPERRAVMARAPAPKTALMARTETRNAGVAFVAVDREVAMVHAIEVSPDQRRLGAAATLTAEAARFAAEHGAETLALAVTAANEPARALYARLGMTEAGGYHYRVPT